MKYIISCILVLGLYTPFAIAGEVEIGGVILKKDAASNSWTFHVTVRHDDTGWDNYVDAWQIVDKQGKILGKRVLFHPHVNEQPFTRSLSDVKLGDAAIIYVEAHDKVHGWSKDRVKIDLSKPQGKRYRIR